MKRKAQISQVFTYLVIILVVGLIVVFGYKGVMSILKTSCEHQRISFEKSLLGFIDEYSDKGSVHEELLKAPCGVKQVCFVNASLYEPSAIPPHITFLGNDPVINSSVDDKKQNIFVRTKFTEPIGFSNKVVLIDDSFFQCFNATSAGFKLLFIGLGRKTQIESG